MVNLRSPVVKDFVTNSSSRTKPQPTFIMVNLLSLVDKPYLFPLLGLFKQVTLWWQPSSLTKSPPTFIMVNLLSLVDKPYLTHYGLFKQVDPLMTTIFPVDITANIVLRTVRSTTLSPPWHFPILLPVRISKIKQEDTLMTTVPNSLLILTWPLTPEDVDQDISSHLQLMSIKMWLNHSLNTSRCILLKMNVEIIFTCNSSE